MKKTDKGIYKKKLFLFLGLTISILMSGIGLEAQETTEPQNEEQLVDVSGRLEGLGFFNTEEKISNEVGEKYRFYFQTVYINFEGKLHPKVKYNIEFMPYNSALYYLGGYSEILEALQQSALDENLKTKTNLTAKEQREVIFADLATAYLDASIEAQKRVTFERLQVEFLLHKMINIRIGNVRNPFGLWDDYSLFRNLNFTKTDPLSLGVKLRRADMGYVIFGQLAGKYLTYDIAILDGENHFQAGHDSNTEKDGSVRFGTSLGPIDLGFNGYARGYQKGDERVPYALGLDFRFRITDSITLLGEYVRVRNQELSITTNSGYLQLNINFEKLRWNLLLEAYKSAILELGDENLAMAIQASTGINYAMSRNLDVGIQIIFGKTEEEENEFRGGFKVDAKF